ncbi:sulfotransferase family protein [Halobacillus salinus]|uniref:Sulfotransferase n=1 Tax=Halobacillus salinus TaxID=192814 RepID=A0A4Z0GYI7_9BACI|nr:sulfotransferase [Halobacillus salinus]TGB01691.1 sulfotransferase [Halobacillus salinus]
MKSNVRDWAEQKSRKYPILHSVYDWGKVAKNTVTLSHPVNSKKDQHDPFFVIGSGRSGNTLLRTMLTKDDSIVIPPESFVLGEVIRKFKMYRFMEWEDLCGVFCSVFERHHGFSMWGIDLQPFYQKAIRLPAEERNLETLLNLFYMHYASVKKPEATRWGDKTPINTFSLGPINQVYKQSQFIHIIRDGRDVVNSYVNAGLYDDVDKAARRWNLSIDIARNFGRKVGHERYHEVHYEDLVRYPEREMRQICSFLGLEFKEDMLDNNKGLDQLGDADQAHHTNLHKPINDSSIGKWKRQMSEPDQVKVQELCSTRLQQLQYQ